MRPGRRLLAGVAALVLAAALGAPAARAEDAATAAIAVDPTTDLIDGQHVTVTGSGWEQYVVAIIYECSADLEQCAGPFAFAGGDAHGAFTVDMILRATFTDEGGPVDCRTEDCVIAAAIGIESAPQERARPEADSDLVVPVTFDPSAPLLDPPSLSARPATGLVDDQPVRVVGDRYVPGDASIEQCPAGFTDHAQQCQYLGLPYIGGTGRLREQVRVRAQIEAEAGTVDCRSADCVLAVIGWGAGETIATTPVAFDPDAPLKPPAELTVTPSTDLVDGQTVVVEGAHFTPGEPGMVVECPVTARDVNDCAWIPHQYAYAGAAGTFRFSFAVAAEILVDQDEWVDCRQAACMIQAGFGGGETRNSASVPISFAADTAPATPTAVTPAFTG